jgi:hypothetical protein
MERLERYRRSTYWVAARHRNLTFLPTRLRESAAAFRGAEPWSVAYVADLAWLYLYALLAALDDMGRLHLAEPLVGLHQVVVGTEAEVREKRLLADQLAALLKGLGVGGPDVPAVDILPDYIDELRDLLARLARRRDAAVEAMRALEFTGVETLASRGGSWEEAFPSAPPYGPKVAADVVRFLVHVGGLDPALLAAFERALGPTAPDAGGTRSASPGASAPAPAPPTGSSRAGPVGDAQARLFDAPTLEELAGAPRRAAALTPMPAPPKVASQPETEANRHDGGGQGGQGPQ